VTLQRCTQTPSRGLKWCMVDASRILSQWARMRRRKRMRLQTGWVLTFLWGVTFAGRVNLSPKLFWPQHRRLRAILTHELSHAHVQGWIGEYKYVYLPTWFKEGLAVMISEGGGAELVSEDEARAAIQRGERLVINNAVSLPNSIDVRLEKTPANTPSWYPVVLAYREAGMFLSYLRESDRSAFDRMMNAILDGRPFVEAVTAGYHDDERSLWEAFIKSSSDRK
jgi:hypothetical protein